MATKYPIALYSGKLKEVQSGDTLPVAVIPSLSAVYQPLDATLTALAAQNWAANAIPIGSGADSLSQVSFAANTFVARASTGNLSAKTIHDDGLTLVGTNFAGMRTALSLGTGDSPQFAAVNLGHATDTTLTRTGAGDIAIEGNAVYRANGTDVPVADGGTGRSSHTAYAVICGGTSSTNAQQSIASVGTTGQVLTSNGAGALPTFQDMFAAQSANRFLAGPASGGPAVPTWRAVVADDIIEAVGDAMNMTLLSISGTLTTTYDDLEGSLSVDIAQGSALSVLGVTGNATADVASIAAGTDHQVLRRSGTSLAFGAVNLAQSAAVTGTLPVGNGGTGRSSHTAYAVICGGTSSTNAQQSIASVGTTGQVLTSNGAGALPTFQDASGGLSGSISDNYIPMGTGAEPELEDSPLSYNADVFNFGAKTIESATWHGEVVDIIYGGTGQSTATDAFAALSPITSRYDMIVGNIVGTPVRLSANITTTPQFLYSIGNGSSTTTFGWRQLDVSTDVTGDLPYTNLAQGSALSVLGVTGNATADVASIAAGTDHQVLRRSGTSLAFGAVNLAQSAAVTGTLPVGNGGTGLTSATQGDILYASGANTWAQLAKNASSTRYLSNTGTSNNPAWAQINLANGVTGTLPIANGGTNATSFGTSNGVVYYNGTSLVNHSRMTFNGSVLQFAPSGSTPIEINWGSAYGGRALTLYDGGATERWGWALQASEMQFFGPSSGTNHVSWNKGGDLQTSGTNEVMRLVLPTGMLKLGGSATRGTTEGTNQLVLFNGTAPAGTLTNGVSLYSASGELRVMDAAGNSTLLSPHDDETNEWIYYSKHTPTGRVFRVRMEAFLKFLNEHHDADFVEEYYERPGTAHHPRWAQTKRWDKPQHLIDQ